MTFFAQGRYLGNIEPRVDPNHYPIKGQVMPVVISQSIIGRKITVSRRRGHGSPVNGTTIKYNDLTEFLLDWRVEKLEDEA